LQLILATGVSRLRAFDVLKCVLRNGGPLSRRVASAALTTFKGNDANELVLSAAEDADPEVQANSVRQLRDRGIPGVLSRLVELIDSPHEIVREAARESLSDFNFKRYLSAFEILQPEVRKCTGGLVTRIDPHAIEELQSELCAASRARRLRGIAVAMAMGVVPQVEAQLLDLAKDSDHFVRADAARSLVHCNSEKSRKLLDELLNDHSLSVQEAAKQATEQLKLNLPRARANSKPALPRFDSTGLTAFPPSEVTP
jgi:HEAT repeat protein